MENGIPKWQFLNRLESQLGGSGVDGGGNVDTMPINAGQSDTAILSGPI